MTSESSRLTRATLLCDVIAYPACLGKVVGRTKREKNKSKWKMDPRRAETTTAAEQRRQEQQRRLQNFAFKVPSAAFCFTPVWLSLSPPPLHRHRQRKRSRHAKVMSLLRRVRLPYSACIPSSSLTGLDATKQTKMPQTPLLERRRKKKTLNGLFSY